MKARNPPYGDLQMLMNGCRTTRTVHPDGNNRSDDMSNFTKGISNLTGPDPNRLFSGYTSATGGGKSKKKKKGGKKPKVGAFSSPEEATPLIKDLTKLLRKRLKPGTGVLIGAGLREHKDLELVIGLGHIDVNIQSDSRPNSDTFIDLDMNIPKVSLIVRTDTESETVIHDGLGGNLNG